MQPYLSVPHRDLTDNQLLAFRADLANWFAGLTAAAGDDTLSFSDHLCGAEAAIRAAASPLLAYLGRIGDHRLSRGHRHQAAAIRDWLARPIPEPPLDLAAMHQWQRDFLALRAALRDGAALELAASRKKKRRDHLEIRVPAPAQAEA